VIDAFSNLSGLAYTEHMTVKDFESLIGLKVEEFRFKALANEDTLLPTHCCRHIVADTNVSPFARACNICCGHKFCVLDTKNVSNFV